MPWGVFVCQKCLTAYPEAFLYIKIALRYIPRRFFVCKNCLGIAGIVLSVKIGLRHNPRLLCYKIDWRNLRCFWVDWFGWKWTYCIVWGKNTSFYDEYMPLSCTRNHNFNKLPNIYWKFNFIGKFKFTGNLVNFIRNFGKFIGYMVSVCKHWLSL